MASLTAKANTGAGTDALAGVTTPDGFAGAVTLVDDTGAAINAGNPAPRLVEATNAINAMRALQAIEDERTRLLRMRRRRDDEAIIALLLH